MSRRLLPHPLTCCLLVVVLALYLLSLPIAGYLLLLAAVACWRRGHAELRQALRRMRWLLLAMLLLAAWTLPGTPLFASRFAPSIAGLQAGAHQALSVLLLALLARGVWLGLGTQGLLAASWPLDALFARAGMPRGRLALRLALTMHYANSLLEQAEKPRLAQLLPYLQPAQFAQAAPDKVQLPLYPWSKWDGVLLAGVLMAVVMKVVA
ncbi:hypothetical protein ACFOLG_07110 [Vogesella facilis]|uniref:Uncharacterized protein n=1 Tax=Vogesella facilis TaxID=1655232 RepID=A0ABV7RDN8_9NEIS